MEDVLRPVVVRFRELRAVGLALGSVLGCSGPEMVSPQTIDSREALTEVLTTVNEPCPDLHEAQSSAPSTRDDLFVEAVVLEVSSQSAREVSLTKLQDLPQTTPVQLVAVPHMLGPYEHPTEMVLGANGAGQDQLSLVRWTMLPRRAERAAVLELELELDTPRSDPVANTSRRTVKFAATVRDNEPALARVEWDRASQRSLLILLRTFEIHGDEDLRAIFQCKMQQHATASHRGGREPRRGPRPSAPP